MTAGGPRAAVQLEADQLEELQKVARMLLAHPLVTSTWPRPGALVAVRRWEVVLRNEFSRVLGYRLDVGRTCARLYRRPATIATTRGARSRTDRPLGPLACSYLCLVLAAAEGLGEQTTASQVADEVQRLRAGDDTLPVDLTRYDQRRAFVDALKWMEDRGVLQLRDGEADQWLAGEDGDALYDVDRDVVSRLLVTAPSVLRDVETVADFLVEPHTSSEEARLQRLRHRIGRRLVGDPVVNLADLGPDELAHLRHRRSRIVADIERFTGCPVELRAEGMVLVDAERHPMSAESFPASGTDTQAALLWGAALVAAIDDTNDDSRHRPAATGAPPPADPWSTIDAATADETWDAIVERYRSRFKAEYKENPDRLRPVVIALLGRFGLVEQGEDGSLRCHAALARYRPSAMEAAAMNPVDRETTASLWDQA